MDRRRAAGALLALAACIACTTAAPTASNQTALDLYESDASEGCYYNFQHYGEGDRIMTNEPCLNCTCHNRMLMCYLRVCPFTKAIGQDCTVEKRADQCCPIVTCPDVPVDLLTSTSTSSPAEYGTTGLGRLDKYGCSMNGKYFPEGSKVPPSPNKPCEHCYCIRNMTTCVMQECTLHVDGCTPIYHKDVCCPVRYSCDHPEDEIPLLDDMTTTVRPTPGFLLTTTTMPSVTQIPQDCVHDDKIFSDGALIKTEKACEHCYCMKGDIVCVVQECGTPMENEGKNCTSLAPKEGQCCPDTYICEGDNELQTDDITTLLPPRRTGVEGSGYRNEDEYTVQPTVFEPEVEGSGLEGSGQEGSELEGSGDKEGTEKPVSITDEAPEVETSAIPVEKDESDMLITTKTPVFVPISTESSSQDSGKYTTEPDKGQNTVPSEDETTVPSVRETTISSDDMHTPELEKDEKTSAEDEKTETPSELEQKEKLATTIIPESHSSLPDIFVTSAEMFDNTEKTTSAESITLKQTDESVTDSSEILEPLATTTEKQESSEIQTVIPLDEKQSKSTTVQLPYDEPVDSEQTHEVTTETLVKLSTTEITDKDSGTTVLTEQDERLSTSTSKYEIPEITSVNPIENEIREEISPIASPGMIPGEGNCLVNGITYGNDSVVPSTNKCQANCKCMSSIVKCDPIMCSGPPENMVNCLPVYDTTETCCPTYICDHGKETIPPQPHSQMSGTESPVTQKTDCIDAECRRKGDDMPSATASPECLAGDCVTETETKDSSECGIEGCGVQPAIDEPSKPEVTKQPEVCLDGNCISPPESCIGDNCQLPVHRDQSCGNDEECDVPHEQICEGPNCGEKIKPPVEESPVCDSKGDCGQSAVPEIPIQTCDGEACKQVPIELPSSEVPQAECSDDSCTKKEITDLENKFGTECKDDTCVPKTPEQPVSEKDNINTELPISQDELGVKVPVIEDDKKHTDLPEVVTKLPESSVTNVQETVTEPEKIDVTVLPISQEEAMVTKSSETVGPDVADTMVTESFDSETKSGTESPEVLATASSKIPEKEAEQESATEEPLLEGPVTEQQEIATKAVEIPSVEEQEISSESPKVTTHEPKFNTESPEFSEKPDMSEYPTTESQSEISKSPEIQLSEEHEKTTVLPEPPATESEEFATKVTDISEEEKLKVTESPEIEQIDTVTKVSEGPVPESHEVSTKPSEQLPVTDTQEFVTKGTETTDISEAAIDEATKIPQLLVTETQDKSTELPEATAHEVEKTTEFYEKPEYPATDSEEKVTMVPESEEEKITEAAVTKSQEETSYDSETAISEQKPEAPVTETMKPLREGSVTYPQNLSTGTAETLATEAPESSVFIKEETPQEPEDKIPKAPEETETAVTESKEKVTEIEENVTDALEKEESAVTESEENITEASKEPQAAVTESEEKLTEAPRETEAAVTESEEKLTKSPKEPEATVIESEEKLTEAPKEPETSVTESEEKVTEASKEPEAAVTESVDRVTEPSKEPEAAVTESEDKVTASPEGPETVVNELEEKITEESTTPETAITDFEGKVTVAPPVPIEKTTEAGEPSDLDEKKEQPVIEPHEKTTMVPDELTPVEEQERPESAITEAQKKATEVPDSIISGYVPEEGVTESEVKATFAPETHQPSDEPQTCEKDGGCDVPLTKPCEGKDCDIDTPPKEVPMVCNNKDDCEQNTVTEVPVQTCDGESCKELPVPDDKQESPVTESTEKVTEAPEAPTLDDKQEKPESFVTETQEKVTESSKTPLPESGDKKVTESPAEQGLEVPITESDQPIREGSVTEPKGEATEAPETTISQEQSYPHATDLGEKATESPEVSLLEENQQSTKSTVTEYSEKPTEAPEVPALEEKPEVSEIPVIDLEEKTTKAPDSSDEKQEMPEQHVTEYTEKVTEIPEIPLSEPETEKVNETLVTESAEKPTASAEKTTESPLIDEKQKIPESSVTDLEEKLTDKPLREGSVTESQEFATAVPEITTVVPELPISEQEIEGLVTKSTESPISDDKQNIPESPVTDSVTESEEKFTESPQEQEQPLTEQQVLATIAPALQDDQQTPESHVTESYEMETKTPEVPTKEPTEDQDIRGDQPATEPQEITTKVPEIVTSGEQDILTEAPVSLVTGLQEEHAVSVSTESQEPTTRIQEAPVSEEEQTSMSPKATEAPQEPMSGEQEVPETDQVKPTNAPITDKQDIPQESGTESVEKATEIPITESQEKATSIPEVTEKPYAPEIQEKETEVPKTQEKATETPEIPALGEKHELPSTESQDMASVTLDESVFDEGEKTSKSPVTEFQDRVTEIPEATISEIEPKLPETFVTEAGKPLPEGSATEPQALGTETPEIPTTAPEMPESPLSESQTTETVASATESEVKATVIPEVPVSQEEPQAPETEEKETEIPEVSVTEYQGKATVAPEIPEPQAPVTQENETEPPEIPEASEAPVTEHQEEATEIPKPIVREEQPQAPESEEIATKAPGVPTSEEEQETLVTQPQDKATEGPEVPISGQEPESSEAPVTEAQEQATEASETPASEDQELIIPSATESQEAASKVPDALTTEVPKKEYSETTPYLVELEEHTHKIEDELSSIAPQDITTTRIDEKTSEDTEKPIFIPDMETFSVAPTTAQESLSTEAGSLGSKYGEPSEDQEIPKATTIAPEKTSEKDEEQTSVSDTEDEKYTSAPSTEKSIEGSAPETNAPEEGPLPSRTTTIKPEEEVTTPELFDKFTKPEPKPTEETVAPEVPKPTTTGQLSDDLPMPEDEAGQFPPSGGTGYGQEPDYVEEDQAFGPGTCRYGGKVYVSAQQIPRDDPCDFCFCFRSDIICLQQSCPPPIHGCHEEPISGFCCPRYECPVSMATTLNVTTTTTTTTTTLPPHFLPHAYKGQAQRRGCQIKGHTYKVGEVVRASSGPCLHCTCGGDGQMKCDPKQCTPEPMLRQMIAAAVSAKRRR